MKALNHLLSVSFSLILGLVPGLGSAVFAQGMDVEPNDACRQAQDMGEVTLPFAVDGRLDTSDTVLTIERQVTASSDDAEESPTGTVFPESSDLELGYEGGGNQTIGIRFSDIGIPPGADVVNAYVQFQVDEISTRPVTLELVAEAADDASAFAANDQDISSRPTTDARVMWDPAPWPTVGDAGESQRTPNIASLLQEVVDRTQWASGNALAVIITGTGKRERVAESFDGNSPAAPVLHVEYMTTGDLNPNTSDVDFFKFTGEAGLELRADYVTEDSADQDFYIDAMLGLFDANCELLDFNVDRSTRVQFAIPAEGVFILAAAGCCHDGFQGYHDSRGKYQVVLAPPPPAINSISGRAVDAVSGEPLVSPLLPTGDLPAPSPGQADLSRCIDGDCFEVVRTQELDSGGRFRFYRDAAGNPLDAGTYQVTILPDQYERYESEPFSVDANQDFDWGDIPLQPPPIRFSDIEPCGDSPSEGGTCTYSVKITNGQTADLRGRVWSMVDAVRLRSNAGLVLFQSGSHSLDLAPGGEETFRFDYVVPETVSSAATICAHVAVGEEPEPGFFPLAKRELFCIEKGFDASMSVMADGEARN